ncbi:MAG: GntR family transcriptional regulator [Deltaproteobacteria bacterium]|nr:GntR family transcriptional regulator [Deltaproteobacteria bacterium]MBW1978879.1 GntR family transcriptional regulator [Deltaproteobacteria bacterium]MBW2299166.1 GntR family transcriptional regulator [Deltaproteobacteria bacterium]
MQSTLRNTSLTTGLAVSGQPKLYKQIWKAIAEGIKEDIISGYYRPGDRLVEAELAAKYDSSKTPVKEALRYLNGIGFVEVVPYKGAIVTKMDKNDVISLYKIQSVLEALAAREALPNLGKADYDKMETYAGLLENYYREGKKDKYEKANLMFHSVVWGGLDNRNLIDLIITIREKLQRYRPITRRYPEKFKELVAEHRKMIHVLKEKDVNRAEKMVRRHYEKNAEIIVSILEREDGF